MPQDKLDGYVDEFLDELYKESKLVQLHRLLTDNKTEYSNIHFPVENVIARVDSLFQLRNTCTADEDWILQKESHDVKTFYKNHESTPNIHSIRLDGIVDAPVFYLLSLLHEVDLFHKWLPTYSFLGLNFAKCIAHPSPTELLVHLNINVPWPFANRYCFFHCDGIDCMDDDPKQIGVLMNVCMCLLVCISVC